MMKISRFFFFLCLALPARSVSAQTGFWLPVNANGWTVITPTDNGPEEDRTRRIYVSNSGDDVANDGLSPESPKKTIDAAMAVTRDGYPDWILLKRGDTFAGTIFANRRWKSGRSASEPMVMTYYGDSGPRPVIKLTSTSKFIDWDGANRNHTAFIGLDLYRSVSDPDSEDFNNTQTAPAFRFVGSNAGQVENVLVEDCLLRYCDIVAENLGSVNRPRNVVIRRNIITYAWVHNTTTAPSTQRTSGIYAAGVDGFILEENVFHHNGYSLKVEGADANQYSHNVYLQYTLGGTILVRGNLLSYGAAHGVQLRSGGTAVMNAFVGNAVAMNAGYSPPPPHYSGSTVIADNVVTDGRPMIPNKSTAPQTGAVWGLTGGPNGLSGDLTANDNIVANVKDTRGTYVAPFLSGFSDHGTGNIAWNWGAPNNNTPEPTGGWAHPDRNADSYAQGVGLSSWKSFIAAAGNRPLGQMPFNLTAYAYVNYIREGFNKAPVTPPYSYDTDCQGISATGITILPSEVTLVAPGDTKELIAAFVPSDACNRGLTWSSDNEDIATVDADGVVTAGAVAGTATITVTAGGGTLTSSVEVTVTGVVGVTGVTLSHQNLSLELGESETLAASILPANATHKEVTWSSNKPAVAVVNAQGVVVGVSNGTAIVTVTTVEGGFTAECEVTVTGNGGYLLDAVNNAYIGSGSFRTHGVQTPEGDGIRSVYTYKPGVPMPAPSGSTWPVSYGGWNYLSPNVTTVYHDFSYWGSTPTSRALRFQNNEGGTLRAMIYWPMTLTVPFDKLGLSVTLGTGSATNSASVYFLVKSGNNFYISAASETAHSRIFERAATSTDWYLWDFAANNGNNFNPVFENPVAAGDILIDAIGIFITGQATGNMVLRDIRQVKYTFEDFDAVPVTEVNVSPSTLTLSVGQTSQLTATVLPENATNRGFTWSSDKENVVTVSASGVVTAVASGTATITATSDDGGLTGICEVNVPVSGYLLDAINNSYRPNNQVRLVGTKDVLPGPNVRSYRLYDPGVPMPVAETSTWPDSYGGWSFLSPNRTTATHEMQYHAGSDSRIRFVNASGGVLEGLIYWRLPDPVVFDGLNLSAVMGSDLTGTVDVHFVIKSGDDLYVSYASANAEDLAANGFTFELLATSSEWQLWDFAANNGDNFTVSFDPLNPANGRRLSTNDISSVDAIGLYLSGNTPGRSSRDIRQISYLADAITLPVRLADFTAERESNTAHLRWSTTGETNSSHFEVQHSLDARSWVKLGEVASERESATLRRYSYPHASPANGLNYYRLKMVDRDGTYEFSPLKSVAINKAEGTITLYPNPATGRFLLKNITEPIRTLEIYNLTGNRIVSLASIPSEGIDVRNLVEGLYVVRIEKSDGTVVNSRIVVQK